MAQKRLTRELSQISKDAADDEIVLTLAEEDSLFRFVKSNESSTKP